MSDPKTRTDRILTKEEQQALTPAQIVDMLYAGNRRFVEGDVTHRDHRAQIRAAIEGQWPKAVVLSCLDSRVQLRWSALLTTSQLFHWTRTMSGSSCPAKPSET